MKKLSMLFVINVLFCFLVGCGGTDSKPSAKAISCASSAIEIGENYLSGDTDYSSAHNGIEEIQEELEYIDDLTSDDENYFADQKIQLHIMSLSIDLISDNKESSSESYDKVQEDIDVLKEDIK